MTFMRIFYNSDGSKEAFPPQDYTEYGIRGDAEFWLSYEEYIMKAIPAAGGCRYFLLWRTAPRVIIGRNQIAEAEVDIEALVAIGDGRYLIEDLLKALGAEPIE